VTFSPVHVNPNALKQNPKRRPTKHKIWGIIKAYWKVLYCDNGARGELSGDVVKAERRWSINDKTG
jgi:hypothetical protein